MGVALHLWGAVEVRGNPGEILFLTFAGGFWLIGAIHLFPWLGLSWEADVVERKNGAACAALSGAMLAVTLVYAGGNLGEGPTHWENFFSAGVGTAGLLVLWLLLELGAKVSVSITEERDLASGVRMGGFLVAIGLILGRAVAGDWVSEEATIRDFVRDGWPALALCALALPVERLARPSRGRPFPAVKAFGLFPAVIYLALASGWLWYLGAWEGMPR